MALETLFDKAAASISQSEKEALLLPELDALTEFHRNNCSEYGRYLRAVFPGYGTPARLSDIPFLPVSVFKSHLLSSVPKEEVFRVLHSSGTTGQQPSRVCLDRETAQLQAQALAAIMKKVLGHERLPMLIVDSDSILKGEKRFTARAVGILGMMNLGRRHTYLLDDNLQLRKAALRAFLDEHGQRPFFAFGFTFLVWQALYEQCDDGEFDLSNATLIHSGGWKKLQDRSVSAPEFRERLKQRLGLQRVYNFYGMVEQVGSVFLEGEDGHLHSSPFGDVLVRDPDTLEVVPDGKPGVIQVLSALPRSYPGHSILTEDLGYVLPGQTRDDAGGSAFQIIGRVPRAELRGCSDTAAPSIPPQ